jgi:hypothetical protein
LSSSSTTSFFKTLREFLEFTREFRSLFLSLGSGGTFSFEPESKNLKKSSKLNVPPEPRLRNRGLNSLVNSRNSLSVLKKLVVLLLPRLRLIRNVKLNWLS